MRKLLLACVAGAALAAAGPAGATSWIVFAGPPKSPAPPKSVPAAAVFDDFYPSLLRVVAGDQVTFTTVGLHTVTFLGPKRPAEFARIVSTEGGYAGGVDRAGQPWWWHGRPKLEYGTAWMTPAGGSTIAGRGELHNTVISPRLKQPHVTYTFSHPGVYRYVCLLHPFMRGTIVVAPPGASVPGAATVLPAAGRRLGHDWAAAAQRSQVVPARPTTVLMGIGATRFSVDSFQPAALTVKVGTTVTFVNRSPADLHDVAFGPPAYLKALLRTTDLVPTSPTATANQVSPFLRYGTDPPGKLVYDGRNHGNGALISPMTDDRAGTCPGCGPGIALPGQTQITFARPGTYRYVCLLHAPEMHGVIVVRR